MDVPEPPPAALLPGLLNLAAQLPYFGRKLAQLLYWSKDPEDSNYTQLWKSLLMPLFCSPKEAWSDECASSSVSSINI